MAMRSAAAPPAHIQIRRPIGRTAGGRGARPIRDIIVWLFALNTNSSARAREGVHEAARSDAERAEFERLFAHYHLPLLDFLYGMTRDREVAADLVQETFLRAYAARNSLADVAYPQAWLYRIASNTALSAGRRRRLVRWLPLSGVEPETGASSSDHWRIPPEAVPRNDDIAVSVAERDAVWSVLAELPPRWRAVLLLQTQAGFRVGEIASLLSLQEGNVRKILFRAKERFRTLYALLEERGGQP